MRIYAAKPLYLTNKYLWGYFTLHINFEQEKNHLHFCEVASCAELGGNFHLIQTILVSALRELPPPLAFKNVRMQAFGHRREPDNKAFRQMTNFLEVLMQQILQLGVRRVSNPDQHT